MTGNQQKITTWFFSHLIPVVKRNPYAARVIRFILENPLYKGLLILGSGTAVAQLIGIVTMPIITRLYTPSDLGVLAVYSSVLAIVGIGATLRYEFAYALPKEDKDAVNLFGLCLVLLLITTTMFAFALFFGSKLLTGCFDDFGVIEPHLWFLLVGFFGMACYTILNYWAVRQRDYARIAHTKINQGIGGTVTKILLGLLAFGPVGLIIGHIVSQIAGIGTLARVMWRKERENLGSISLSGMKQVAQAYMSFPIFNLPASIVNTMALQLPPLMLLAIYDARIAGFYALAHTVVVLPGNFISQSMGQAYLGEASKMVRDMSSELRALYLRTLKHLTVVGIPLIGIPALFAPFLFEILFGEVWVEAGWYCWPLGLIALFGFIAGPTSFLHLYGYNHWQLMWDVTRLVGVVIGFYVGYIFELSIFNTLFIYAIIRMSLSALNVFLNLKALSNYFKMSIK